MGYALKGQPPRMKALRKQDWERGLNPRDATPGLPDVLLTFFLVGGRAGRVIRGNQIHPPGEHFLPQRLSSRRVADRWRTLQRRADALEVLLGEGEKVRARLRGDRHALVARRINLSQSLGAADVDDVRAHAFAGAAHADDQPLNRFDLGARRTGATPGQPIHVPLFGLVAIEYLLTFSMNADDRTEACGSLEADREHPVGHAVKIVDAAVTHEGLEADYPPLVEDREV